MVLYFGSLDRNEKEKCINGTKKCSQYNMKIIMIDKFQQPNYECLIFFFFFCVIGKISICKSYSKFVLFLVSLIIIKKVNNHYIYTHAHLHIYTYIHIHIHIHIYNFKKC